MNPRSMRATMLTLVIAHLPFTASAQIQGKIVDTFGNPVAEVHVELWRAAERLAFTTTNTGGYFYFLPDRSVIPTGIVARRIGYRPLTASFGQSAADRTYVMERVSIALPDAVSSTSRSSCPNVEDPDARSAWKALRQVYFHPPYRYSWSITAVADSGFVEARNVGQVDEIRMTGTGIGIGGAQRLADSARLANSGYAYMFYRTVAGRPQPKWAYAKLHSYMVQHFLDPLFGARHTLSWAEKPEPGEWSLMIFCPKKTRFPSISGTLVISSDSSLVSASWRFHTSAPDEDAGGTVNFAPSRRTDSPRVLLPAMSIIWRRGTGFDRNYFYQTATRYERLHLNYYYPPNRSDPVVKPDSASR